MRIKKEHTIRLLADSSAALKFADILGLRNATNNLNTSVLLFPSLEHSLSYRPEFSAHNVQRWMLDSH